MTNFHERRQHRQDGDDDTLEERRKEPKEFLHEVVGEASRQSSMTGLLDRFQGNTDTHREADWTRLKGLIHEMMQERVKEVLERLDRHESKMESLIER